MSLHAFLLAVVASTSVWGGPNARLTIGKDALFEFSCAHGAIAPEGMRAFVGKRHFDVLGNYFNDRASQIRVGGNLPVSIVHYKGSFIGARLYLTIAEAHTGQIFGKYTLQRGTQGHVEKCY